MKIVSFVIALLLVGCASVATVEPVAVKVVEVVEPGGKPAHWKMCEDNGLITQAPNVIGSVPLKLCAAIGVPVSVCAKRQDQADILDALPSSAAVDAVWNEKRKAGLCGQQAQLIIKEIESKPYIKSMMYNGMLLSFTLVMAIDWQGQERWIAFPMLLNTDAKERIYGNPRAYSQEIKLNRAF
jgi:hypothetical protein